MRQSSVSRAHVIRRLVLIAPVGALLACASTDSASRAEVAALRAELRAVRAEQDRLEKRLERAEMMAAVASARKGAASGAGASEPDAVATPPMPELAVVKLKPKRSPAPRIDTSRPVLEPPQEVVEELATPEPEAEEEPEPAENAQFADKMFEQAMEALRTGNLTGAAAALEQFAQDHPRNPRADNALYFGALGYIGLEQPAQAAELLERLVKNYPAGDAVLDALLKLAECRLSLKQTSEAQALYHQVISTYPGTAAADKAQAKLASLSM